MENKKCKIYVSFNKNEKDIVNETKINLTQNDYNSVEFDFEFDKEDGTKVFELKKPDGTIWVKEIPENNQLVLVDFDENENPLIVLNQDGIYKYEISVYDENKKITTSSVSQFSVRKELVVVDDDEIAEDDRLPILDDLINRCETVKNDGIYAREQGDYAKNQGDYAKEQGDYAKEKADEIIDLIPTKLSQLEDDSTHRTVTDTEKTTWNNKSDFSGDYNDLTNKPTIPIVPTNVSAFNNDAGYITKDVDNLTNYTKTGDMSSAINTAVNGEKDLREAADNNLQSQIDAITARTDVVDVVGTYTDLQNYDTSTLTNDDVIKVLSDNTHNDALSYFRWVITGGTGSWSYVGSEGPFYTKSEADSLLNAKQDTIDSTHKLNADLVDDTNTTNKFTNATEKQTWNDKVGKTDYATDNVGGVIKTGTYGTQISSGQLSAKAITYSAYSSANSNLFVSKGTLENVITGKGLVSNTDYASSSKGGVIVPSTTYGTNVSSSSGTLYGTTYTYADYQTKNNNMFVSKGTLDNVITGKNLETANNKVTSLTSSSTDTQYPSAKCVYDIVGNIESILEELDIGGGI